LVNEVVNKNVEVERTEVSNEDEKETCEGSTREETSVRVRRCEWVYTYGRGHEQP